jgi:hypothetical protein
MSSSRRNPAAWLVAALAAVTCLVILATASPAAASVFRNSERWDVFQGRPGGAPGHARIPVCIVEGSSVAQLNADAPIPALHPPNPTLAYVIAQIRDSLHDTWETGSSVRFVDWRPCPQLSAAERAAAVGFYIHPEAGNGAFPGRSGRGRTTAAENTIHIRPWGQNANPDQCIRFRELYFVYDIACAREYAAHEFGHVLGFQHEWYHPLTPSTCTNDDGVSPLGPADLTDTWVDDGRYTISNRVQFDRESLMVYGSDCANVTGERFGSPGLSPFDAEGLRRIYPPVQDVGVLRTAAGCGPAEPVVLELNGEQTTRGSSTQGWTGSSHASGGNTTLAFCRADGLRFTRTSRPYAVLRLGPECPAGSWPVTRLFDAEDDGWGTRVSDAAAADPSLRITFLKGHVAGDSDLILQLCYFPAASAMPMPSLGRPYGVFALPGFPGAVASGSIHTDDENDGNMNDLAGAMPGVLEAGPDTTLHVVQVLGDSGPSITDIAPQTTDEDVAVGPLAFTLADPDTRVDALSVRTTTTNPAVVPASGVALAGSGASRSVTITPAPEASGSSLVTVLVTDGRWADSTTFLVQVHAVNDSPAVTLVPGAPVAEGAWLELEARASDAEGDPLDYEWAVSAGELTGSGASPRFRLDDGPASPTVTVTVRDPGGATATATQTLEVANVAPRVFAGPDVATYWGVPVSFAAEARDASAADTAAGLSSAWRFGDGSSGERSMNATRAFAAPGRFVADVRATDKDGGQGSDTREVVVDRRPTSVEYKSFALPFGAPLPDAVLVDGVDAATSRLANRKLLIRVDGADDKSRLHAHADAAGVVRVTLPEPLAPGSHALAIEFPGDDDYAPSSVEVAVDVLP